MAKKKMVDRKVAVGVGVTGAVLLVAQFAWWNKRCPDWRKKGKGY